MIRGMKTGIIHSEIYHEDGGDDNDDLDAIVEVAALLGVILLKLGLPPVPPPKAKNLFIAIDIVLQHDRFPSPCSLDCRSC